MKLYTNYVLACITIFLISSCISKDLPSDPLDYFKNPPVIIEPVAIITPDTPILQSFDIKLVQDSIAVLKIYKVGNYLALVNTNTGEVMREFITKGQGPGELITMFFCPQSDKNKIMVEDPNLRTIFNVDYNMAIADNKYRIEPLVKFENRAMRYMFIDTCFVHAGLRMINNRFQIFDSKGGLIATCLNYNKADKYSHVPDRVYASGFQGFYAVHPNGKKFVFAAHNSGCIQIFNFTPNEITLHKDLTFNDPMMTCNENACATSLKAIVSAETIDCNDKYFYVLYSGETLDQHLNKIANYNLLVFDWDGNPVKRYILQQPITTFAVNSADDKLYGVADMPDGIVIAQYNLN